MKELRSISKYKSDSKILESLINQVNKDFSSLQDEVFELGTETEWDVLIDQLEPIIDRLVNLDSDRFFRLLYTIDVDERKVKSILFGDHNERTSWSLTVLILERELLKVITKKHFSNSLE